MNVLLLSFYSPVPAPFEVEVFISGFVSTRRNPENATRSQRAFMRLAKSKFLVLFILSCI